MRFPKSKLPNMSNKELAALSEQIQALPENRKHSDRPFDTMYTPKAQRQLDDIAFTISSNLRQKKETYTY